MLLYWFVSGVFASGFLVSTLCLSTLVCAITSCCGFGSWWIGLLFSSQLTSIGVVSVVCAESR